MMAAALYWMLPAMSPFAYAGFVLASFVLGVWLCGRTARDIDRKSVV